MSYNSLFGLGSHSEDANLQACWFCQDNAASTAVDDNSSNAADGVLQGGDNTEDITTTGPNSYLTAGLAMDGLADYVSFASAVLDIASDITFVAWVNAASLAASEHLLGAYNTAGSFNGYGLRERSSDTSILEWWNGSTFALSNTGLLTTSSWIHVAVTNDNSNTTFYKNSSSHGSPAHGNPNSWTGDKVLGGRSNGDSLSNCTFAGVAVFDRALSSAEVAEVYNGPEVNHSSGASIDEDGVYSVGTWALNAPFSSGSNGTVTYEVVAAKGDGTVVDTATASSGTLDLSSAAGATVYLLVRASNTGGYDLGDKATRTSSYGSTDDGYYELASVTAAGGAGGATAGSLGLMGVGI